MRQETVKINLLLNYQIILPTAVNTFFVSAHYSEFRNANVPTGLWRGLLDSITVSSGAQEGSS